MCVRISTSSLPTVLMESATGWYFLDTTGSDLIHDDGHEPRTIVSAV